MDAASNAAIPQTELVPPGFKPQEISFALPKALHTTAHIHLTALERCATVFITTSTPGDSAGSFKPLGSFVYAMPDRTHSKSTISTTLYTVPSSIEYTTRVAKIIARRIDKPVYVGCSIDPNGLGLTVEEEMEGLKKIVDVIAERYTSGRKQ
ncbi:hypothetical protein N7468_007606 [Penicillium chermesinum]|uniref:Uncharacterized protein n=1 Tax=Penicillium chermesinum TaxID=63820 RepID=A0A9W9NUC6_9EURO|nr:uncharacterized protein N7468_007606 [Penicillium chermesinum]KAJ5226381.1 hypothetical protein N7468_007606 [Penicillium chermesinum]KAJ6160433.1 hypothetical protein N7470_003829 [Penicillium chermesinum]